MSVDKFGRRSDDRKRRRGNQPGPKGEGYTKTAEGDYDIIGKRLVNLGDAQDAGDAVNLRTVTENCLYSCRQQGEDCLDAKRRRVVNVHPPVAETDAVDFATVQRFGPKFEPSTGRMDMKGHVLNRVARPVDKSDAATKIYVDSRVPTLTDNGVDFANKRAIRVSDPVDPFDVVNLQYLEGNTVNHRYLHEMLSVLSFTVFSKLRPDAQVSYEIWKDRVMSMKPPFGMWRDLFN